MRFWHRNSHTCIVARADFHRINRGFLSQEMQWIVVVKIQHAQHHYGKNLTNSTLGPEDINHGSFARMPHFPLEDGFRHLMAVKPLSCCQSHSGQSNMLGHVRHTGAPHLNSKSSIVLWHDEM